MLDGKVAVITGGTSGMALAGAKLSLTKGLTSSSRVDEGRAGRGRRAHRPKLTGVQADSPTSTIWIDYSRSSSKKRSD